MHFGFNSRLSVLGLSLLVVGASGAYARELVPEDDGPEQQEEVMPVMPAEAPPEKPAEPSASVPKWTAPSYSGQSQALGWSPEAFNVPVPMEERVQFWRNIYTKYTSDQGILHDSKYLDIIYERVEFGDITAREDLTDRQKEKERRKRVKAMKKEIEERLKNLQKFAGDPATLDETDRRYLNMFSRIDEPKKFTEAAGRKRLRFQLGQRNQFAAGIYQSGRYLKQMEEIFRQEGVPIELTRLPYVESSFNFHARSRVGATGLWQFMRSTARLYMRMDPSADERNDPLRATRAAAKKLRDNFQMLRSWPLAITAYNHGPNGVKRLTEKMHTTDICDLIDVRKGRFGFASANFFASFLAALDVERSADKNFGVLEVMPELRGAEVQLIKSQYAKDFLKWFGGDEAEAELLNPHVSEAVWKNRVPLSRKHILRVPLLQETQARGALE
jgi:membrane-bound lytic murein transglycosylase D